MMVYRKYPGKTLRDTYTPAVVKLQTVAAALALSTLFFAILFPLLFLFAALLLAGILVSSIPFAVKTFKKDPIIGLLSPIVVLVRAFVFSLGSLFGLFQGKLLKSLTSLFRLNR